MRRLILVCTVATGLVLVWFAFRRSATIHPITLLTYLQRGAGLRSSARVQVDGVDLGSVTSVRVRPELGDHPIEVVMAIKSPYQLRIPADSAVMLATEGVLGPTFVEIDTHNAHGPPAAGGAVLESFEVSNDQAGHAVEQLGNALVETSKKVRGGQSQTPSTGPAAK